MKKISLKIISAIMPYVAVLVGLYIFKSAWIAIGLYHFGIIVFLISGDRNRLLKIICSGWNSKAAVISVVMSVTILPALLLFWKYLQLENISLNSALTDLGLHGTWWFFFMIYFSTVQPLLEELYWRGYLIHVHSYFSWADFAFAGYHILVLMCFIKWPWLVIAFILLTLTSFIWRFISFRFGGLIIPLLSHAVADISIIVVTYVLIH